MTMQIGSVQFSRWGRRIAVDPMALVRTWWRRRQERLVLADLDARMLRDIGITEGMAKAEAAKPFWLP